MLPETLAEWLLPIYLLIQLSLNDEPLMFNAAEVYLLSVSAFDGLNIVFLYNTIGMIGRLLHFERKSAS